MACTSTLAGMPLYSSFPHPRESECVCARVFVCERERAGESVRERECVREREKEKERARESERERARQREMDSEASHATEFMLVNTETDVQLNRDARIL